MVVVFLFPVVVVGEIQRHTEALPYINVSPEQDVQAGYSNYIISKQHGFIITIKCSLTTTKTGQKRASTGDYGLYIMAGFKNSIKRANRLSTERVMLIEE